MITTISQELRRGADHGWLKTHYLFSFADYWDPRNMGFGTLRVFNDDYIAGNSGFPPHQHANMEIVTIVLDGEINHEDSMGNKTTIRAGEVQRMSAGTGVTHAEENKGNNQLHLYQIWIFPKEQNITPSYEQKDFTNASRQNVLLPLVSNKDSNALSINTDVTIYDSHLEKGKSIELPTTPDRGIFIYARTGSLRINNEKTISALDQARITGEAAISIQAIDDSEFILIDVPA
jgi:redox-sensitive bicupin YhaK (pirin superfamily)